MIWRGLGYLVPVISLAAFVVTEIVTRGISGDPHFYQEHAWPKLLAAILAAAMLAGWGLALAKKSPQKHAFLGILMHHWAPVPVLLGGAIAFIPPPSWEQAAEFDATCRESCGPTDGTPPACAARCTCMRQNFERRYQSWSKLVAFSHTNKAAFDRDVAQTRAKCDAR
jgi:hypothetical protein